MTRNADGRRPGAPPKTRMSRVRLSLVTPDGTAVLRVDGVIRTADLNQLVPVTVQTGEQGSWTFNLMPDNSGGAVALEILG